MELFQAGLLNGINLIRLRELHHELAPLLPDEVLAALAAACVRAGPETLISLTYSGQPAGIRPSSTQQSVPSWIVFGMFFVIIPLSTIFIDERRQGTLLRTRVMNVGTVALFAGKLAPYLIINLLQAGLMILVGMYVVPLLGGAALTPGGSGAGLLLISFSLSLAATGTALMIAVLAQTVEQATTIGGIINILLGSCRRSHGAQILYAGNHAEAGRHFPHGLGGRRLS